MTSYVDLHSVGTNFTPTNPIEFLGIYSTFSSSSDCAKECHQNPECRTFVFDPPSCRLYVSSSNTGSIVYSSSMVSVVGTINYDNINLKSSYNQSCDHCYPDRYLVCQNNTCQCPLNTYWDGNQNQCMNNLFVNSPITCQNDNWCRQDLNLSCQCGQCQCPLYTFWNNIKCVSQFLSGSSCNNSNQCRNDLNLTCSRTSKTCTPLILKQMNVTNGIFPAKFAGNGIALNNSGGMDWRNGFDGSTSSYWNTEVFNVTVYILLSFDDIYMLNSLQVTIYGGNCHDLQIIQVYLDENAICLAQSFPVSENTTGNYVTFPPYPFNYITSKPVIANQLLLAMNAWCPYQIWIFEISFFGALY